MLENDGECWRTTANAGEQRRTLQSSRLWTFREIPANPETSRQTTKKNGGRRRRRMAADETMEHRRRSGSSAAIPRGEKPRSKDKRDWSEVWRKKLFRRGECSAVRDRKDSSMLIINMSDTSGPYRISSLLLKNFVLMIF